MSSHEVSRPAMKIAGRSPLVVPVTTLTLITMIGLSGLVDLPRAISLGPVTSLALLTALYCSGVWLLWAVWPILTRSVLATVWPLIALVLWGFSSFAWYAPTLDGVQNLLVLLAFLGCIVLAASKSYLDHKLLWRAWAMVGRATWIAVGLYGISSALGGLGNEVIISPRGFGLFALLGVAWYLAAWRYGSRRGLWQAVAVTFAIALSLSRLALAIALVLFPLSQASLRNVLGWLRASLLVALAVGLSYLAVMQFEPLRERFFEGDVQLQVGGTAVNVSGREALWRVTWNSWRESPWIGKGVGSAEEVVKRSAPESGHPHNDYLRVLHDYGVIGLGLWLLALVSLLWATWRAWAQANHRGSAEAQAHLAACLSLVAFAMGMITDNVMVYIFVVAPLGIVVGASIGRTRYS